MSDPKIKVDVRQTEQSHLAVIAEIEEVLAKVKSGRSDLVCCLFAYVVTDNAKKCSYAGGSAHLSLALTDPGHRKLALEDLGSSVSQLFDKLDEVAKERVQ